MTHPIGPSYRENKRLGGIQTEPVQYPADQARRETLVLLRQIRNGVSFIAVVALLACFFMLIAFIAAVGS